MIGSLTGRLIDSPKVNEAFTESLNKNNTGKQRTSFNFSCYEKIKRGDNHPVLTVWYNVSCTAASPEQAAFYQKLGKDSVLLFGDLTPFDCKNNKNNPEKPDEPSLSFSFEAKSMKVVYYGPSDGEEGSAGGGALRSSPAPSRTFSRPGTPVRTSSPVSRGFGTSSNDTEVESVTDLPDPFA